MNLKIIKTEKDYQAAVGRIYELMNSEKIRLSQVLRREMNLNFWPYLLNAMKTINFPKRHLIR